MQHATNLPDVVAYLNGKGSWRFHGNEAIGFCPACNATHERSLSVNTETGQWCCNRKNNCDAQGGFRDLMRLYGDEVEKRPRLVSLPSTPISIHHKAKGLKDNGRAFLKARGFTDLTIDEWRIGQERVYFGKLKAESDALAWPVFDAAGKLVNIKYRALSGKDFSNQKGGAKWPIGVNLCHHASGKRLIVCEGELDAMTGRQYGLRNIVSLPNGAGDQTWIDLAWDWLQQFDEIVLATDGDAAGDKARAEIARRLGYRWALLTVKFPDGHKDLNACLMAGVEAERITAAFASADEVKPENIHWADHWVDEVVSMFNDDGGLDGTPSLFPELDAMLRGFRPSEMTVWTGQSGSGKSTVLGQLAVNWLTTGTKTAAASLELRPPKYLRWMTMQAGGSARLTESQIRDVHLWMGTGVAIIDHLGSVDVDQLLTWFGYCAARFGCRQFICDSLQLVTAGADELKAQKDIVQKLLNFAAQYGVHVHLVAHPRKAESDQHETGKVDVKGNSSITDLAHNVIAVVRMGSTTKLRLLKNREHGKVGDCLVMVDEDCKQVMTRGAPDYWAHIATAVDGEIPDWLDTPEPLTGR